jgi:flavin reductase (DIM6/NTAB) family NADH-FMN oxidoreductase RutF
MNESGCHWSRAMPETRSELSQDSRWPAFFPSPISFVTTGHGEETGLEKVVGASIINRFPFLIGLSFCRETLSDRHHARRRFMEILEREGGANVQFLPPGAALDRAMGAIQNVPDERTSRRIEAAGLEWRPANSSRIPILRNSYLTYETRFVEPGHDFEGRSIFERPWLDVGSHRLYFMEIHTIRLREDIARGERQIVWRSLPSWKSESNSGFFTPRERNAKGYVKGYNPNYRFPATGTIAFEADAHEDGMAVKRLPRLAEDQVEVDNDRARWPCFFPSSVGMITCYSDDRTPNVMPCGSTFVVSRDPLIIAPCISYAAINERYAPRASLNMIRASGVFGCGVPYIGEGMVEALRLTGNTSFRDGRSKVADAGCEIDAVGAAPRISGCPIHFECEITKEFPLGTHALLLGKVTRIDVRADVTPCNPVEWLPWAALSSE